MLHALQIITIILVAVAMAPALAHALEFPGKMRLDRDAYVTVQGIYYPGFTIAGVSEPLALIAAVVLLLLTPQGTTAYWLRLVAASGMLLVQVIFWTFIQPVNRFWLRSSNVALGNVGGAFFAVDPQVGAGAGEVDWTKLRDRWEHSHLARAALVFVSFLSLLLA